MSIAEIRMLRGISNHTLEERIQNENIQAKLEVVHIEDKTSETHLR